MNIVDRIYSTPIENKGKLTVHQPGTYSNNINAWYNTLRPTTDINQYQNITEKVKKFRKDMSELPLYETTVAGYNSSTMQYRFK